MRVVPLGVFSCSCTLVAGYSGRSAVVGPTVYKRIHLKKKNYSNNNNYRPPDFDQAFVEY